MVTQASGGIEWGEPKDLPEALPPVLPFDPDMLPPKMLPWIADVVDRMQCPMDFPAIGALTTLAAVIGRQCGIRPLSKDDWTVIPNLWGAVVGRPGTMKSPALQEAIQSILALEDVARRQHKDDLLQHQADLEIAKATKTARQKELKEAIEGNGDAKQIAVEVAAAVPDAPVRTRYLLFDTSVEMIGVLLAENPRGVLVFRDELTGWLRSLDKQGQEGARAFFLEAWNGSGSFAYDRIGRGTLDIEAACVSILGGIQPGPLGEYLRSIAKGGGADDGLIQRFQLLVNPDPPKNWSHRDRSPDIIARNKARDVYERLDCLSPENLYAEVDRGIPFLRFTPEAQEAFVEWRTELEPRVRSGNELPVMEAHLSKYRSLIPALALIDHLVEVGSGPVTEASFIRAATLGEYLESHARRIYAPVVNPAPAAAKALADRILSGHVQDGFSLRDNVYQNSWSRLSTAADAQMAADILESAAWIYGVEKPTHGRTAVIYCINPKILERVRG
jgi:putative DNA primase/helicase